jgi:uncharacterized protein involved in outer membrane biogenesis
MQKTRKIITWTLVVIGIIASALFIAASVYINRFKPQLEELLTRNIGLETRIDGAISLKVMPGLSFSAHKVKVISNETYILRIEKIEISVDYTKLFDETVYVKKLHFKRPQIYVVRNLDGTYNFDTPMAMLFPRPSSAEANHQIDLSELTVYDASILYIDKGFHDTLTASGVYLDSEDIDIAGRVGQVDAMKMKFLGSLRIDQFKMNSLIIDSMIFEVQGDKGKLRIEEKSKPFLGGQVSGKILFDFNQTPIFIHNQHQVTGLVLEDFFKSIGSKPYLTGLADYTLDLNFNSVEWATAMQSMTGTFNLSGQDLVMKGIDLHRKIDGFQRSVNFSSVDLLAIFLAGPYGAVFTKGMDFQQLISGNPEDETPIKALSSSWKIREGVATPEDVAFNTGRYRIAIKGAIDFTRDQFQNTQVAILNRKGCAAFGQVFTGPFDDPVTEGMVNLGLINNLTGDLAKTLAAPSQTACNPVYSGSIKHPVVK